MTRHRIHQLINPRQRAAVFGTCLIELGEVDVDSLFAALLHQDWVGEPPKVVCHSDEIRPQQPINLFTEILTSLRIHLPQLLLNLRVNG